MGASDSHGHVTGILRATCQGRKSNFADLIVQIRGGDPRTYQLPARQKSVWLPPQPFKPCRIGRRVSDGVLNIPVPQVVLNQSRVGALVGQGKAARVAQHMRVGFAGQACEPAIITDHQPCGFPMGVALPLPTVNMINFKVCRMATPGAPRRSTAIVFEGFLSGVHLTATPRRGALRWSCAYAGAR
jgi:hypothetical protein